MGLVKDVNFLSERRVGSVLPQIKIYNMREVDELIILDISASRNNTNIDFDEIKEFAKHNFIPLTVGGGISKLAHIEELLLIGADKISINSASYTDKKFIKEAVYNFGSQCIVSSIDYKIKNEKRLCHSISGSVNENKNLIEWIETLQSLGVGEFLLTSIDLDGTMKGYDLELLDIIREKVNIPIIISGGCGSYNDMLNSLNSGADAVAASSIFHFTQLTPNGAKSFLHENGIHVRI